MMVHAAVSQLYMFGFWYGSAYYLPTAPVDGMPGVFKVDVPEWAMDIVGAEDLDECAESPCDPNAMCYGQAGATAATAMCVCNQGYVGDGRVCALEQHSYTPTAQDYYLRLYHTDAIRYGWRVSEIVMYLDEECTQELPLYEGALMYPPPPGCDPFSYPPSPGCDK